MDYSEKQLYLEVGLGHNKPTVNHNKNKNKKKNMI